MNPRYDAAEAEPRIMARWLESGLFQPEVAGAPGENFSTPNSPPNVTGDLHMGHALNMSIRDALVRYHRARHARTKWVFGTDHAGIATQRQVEKRLAREGTSREALGRAAFEQRVWEWRDQYGPRIVDQFKRLGASADFADEQFTLDPGYVEAVLKVFVDLYERGCVYRDNYMVNWDPGSGSAISNLEVEDREVTDTLYSIAYPLVSGEGAIIIATVRPETTAADVAVAVHPDDERYRHLVGQEAILPLVGRRLPIVADEYVKPEFGTGAVKIAPGHDPNDFEVGRRHGLPEISVIGEDGRMNAAAGAELAGRTVAEAQEVAVALLRAEGAIVGEEELVHDVPFSHRSGARIEPLISLQWFVRLDALAPRAIAALERGDVRIHPERWTRPCLDWMHEPRPWCISRQLWWGQQLPVWYRGEEMHVALEPPEGEGWVRDADVLDTWFSAAVWPFAALGWPRATPELEAFYPTDFITTARDILLLWIVPMIMVGIEFTDVVPFRNVYVHSIIQAPDGRRMSKSLGTGVDPLGEVERYGADGVRFGVLAMSSTQDVRYSTEKLEQGQRLAKKLWSAARLILMHADHAVAPAPRAPQVEDRWILSRLAAARADVEERIEQFDLAHAATAVWDFVFGELCDWYLELAKPRLHRAQGAEREQLSALLLHVLIETLTLAHPIVPFVTEEIWSYVPGAEGLLAGRKVGPRGERDAEAEREIAVVVDAVRALRAWRKRAGVPNTERLRVAIVGEAYAEQLATIVRLAGMEAMPPAEREAADVAVALPAGTAYARTRDVIDTGSVMERLNVRKRKVERAIERYEALLAAPGFAEKAPVEVVRTERDKLDRLRRELETL